MIKENVKLEVKDADDELINSSIVKFNYTEAAIGELKERYMQLKVADPNDKEGYKQVHIANMDIKAKISAVTDLGKSLRASAIREQKTIIAVEKQIVGLLMPVREHLEAQKAIVDDEKKRKEEQKQKFLSDRYIDRAKKLSEAGMVFNGASYNYKNHTIQGDSLRDMEDSFFDAFHQVVKTAFDADSKQKSDEAAAAKKLQDDLAAQKKENDELQAKLKKQQDDLKLQQEQLAKDQAKINKAKNDERLNKLTGLGLKFNGQDLIYKDVNFHWTEVVTMPDEDFLKAFEGAEKRMVEIKAEEETQQQELINKKAAEKVRIDALINAGFSFDGNYYFVADFKRLDPGTIHSLSDADFNEVVESGKDKLEEIANAKLNDKKRIEGYAASVLAVPLPTLKDKKAAAALKSAVSKINEAIKALHQDIKKL